MPNPAPPKLVITAAFHQEALPLIQAYRLKREHHIHAFEMYRNADIALVETGLGRVNAANAVGFCAGLFQGAPLAWLNLGCAGHCTYAIGSGFLIHKITLASPSNLVYYPDLSLGFSANTASLRTRDHLVEDYPATDLCDMEAAGFFSAALHYSCLELIHCFKVVSDNLESPYSQLDKHRVTDLIEQQMPMMRAGIAMLLQRLDHYRQTYQVPAEYAALLEQIHFTHYQREQLKHLLHRWHNLAEESVIEFLTTLNPRKGAMAIQALSDRLDTLSR